MRACVCHNLYTTQCHAPPQHTPSFFFLSISFSSKKKQRPATHKRTNTQSKRLSLSFSLPFSLSPPCLLACFWTCVFYWEAVLFLAPHFSTAAAKKSQRVRERKRARESTRQAGVLFFRLANSRLPCASRADEMACLFCKRAGWRRPINKKETHNNTAAAMQGCGRQVRNSPLRSTPLKPTSSQRRWASLVATVSSFCTSFVVAVVVVGCYCWLCQGFDGAKR